MAERILIVDDEIDMLELLELIITDRTEYEVVTTNSPLEVPELLKKEPFDLLITDLRMPDIDGIELIEMVKQVDDQLPFIIITAYGTIESAVEAMRKGAFDYITKPFRQEQILLTIEKVMKWRRLQKENIALKAELEKMKKGADG
ncbi:MAG: sigma-54-dependent Fis family transcriptional regulator [Deltaproteobacteria bacterium]|jgi:DNA-binding NtrC family response regulator|nr:sigma-54-dependent Fis family transcriptional regulator [Deltaproteobacteria bacterium]